MIVFFSYVTQYISMWSLNGPVLNILDISILDTLAAKIVQEYQQLS